MFGSSLVAKKALDGMDTDGTIQIAAIAGGFARMIADPAVHRRERVVANQPLPGLPVLAGLREAQPALDVLPCRAGVVTKRQQIDIDRMGTARRSPLPAGGSYRSSGSCRE